MFILSAGMPKSGSTLFSLYQRDIVESILPGNGQVRFEQMIRDARVNGIGIFVHDLASEQVLDRLAAISLETGPFVIKTHTALTPALRRYLASGVIRATYIHRDPRDVILSAMDHGARPPDHPARNEFFLQFDSIPRSIPIVRQFCREGIEWISSGLCRVFTYHDLLVSPVETLTEYSTWLGAAPDPALYGTLISRYAGNPVKGKKQYNTGKLLRYPDEMPADMVRLCTTELAGEIRALGYPSD